MLWPMQAREYRTSSVVGQTIAVCGLPPLKRTQEQTTNDRLLHVCSTKTGHTVTPVKLKCAHHH
jgi:hypothetical protein